MNIKTIMMHLELAQATAGLLTLATDLATRLGAAHLIGIAGCQPIQLVYTDTYATGDIMAADREEIEAELKKVQQRFHETCKGKVKQLEWRSNVTGGPLADYIASEARAADLVITGPDIGGSVFDHARQVRIADLVFQAGRPVLIVPAQATRFALDHVVVAWKDVREARRALADALPMLHHAGHVTIVEIAADREAAAKRVDRVAGFLASHGIKAKGVAPAANGDDAISLERIADEHHADLIVAGAYGHSRLREWALGGVTRDLLVHPRRCALVSH